MSTLEDDVLDQPVVTPTLTDTQSSIIPSGDALNRRAVKADFALGDQSPGIGKISSVIAAGDEQGMRQAMATDSDLESENYKNQIIMQMAMKSGGKIHPDDVELVRSMTANETKTDPATVLERKFAERWINQSLVYQDELREDDFRAAHQATDLTGDIMKLHTTLEDLNTKYENSGFWTKLGRNVEQVIPGIPWWRQAQALKDRPNHYNLLPGDTIKDNVVSWWGLPPDKRMETLKSTVEAYEKDGRYLDAMTFVNALIAFPASDEFLANAMGVADYTSFASAFWKLGKVAAGVAGLGKAGVKGVLKEGINAVEEGGPRVPPSAPTPPPAPEQLDLFGNEPFNGQFRFMSDPDVPPQMTPRGAGDPEVSPTGLVRNPKNGQMMRATTRDSLHPNGVSIPHNTPEVPVNPNTGVFRGQQGRFGKTTENMVQRDLPLDEPQADLFGSKPLTDEEKYAAAGRSQPPEGGYSGGTGVKHAPEPEPIVSPQQKADEAKLRMALADRVKAVADPTSTPREVLSQVGNIPSAGLLGALKLLRGIHTEGIRELASFLPTFANPVGFWKSAKSLDKEFATKAAQTAQNDSSILMQVSQAASRPVRLPPAALEVAKNEAKVEITKKFNPTGQNMTLDWEYLPSDTNPWGVDTMVAWVGKHDNTLFSSRAQAEQYAKEVYGFSDNFVVEPHGDGYKIGKFKHLNEESPNVLDAFLSPDNTAGGGIVKQWLSKIVGADNLLSKFQNAQRKVATHGQNAVKAAVKEMIDRDFYKALGARERDEVEKVLVENRDGPNKINPSERGFWHETAQEFESAYLRLNGHLPTEKAVKAYDTFRRANDIEYLWRNWTAYRDLARRGVEQFQFTHTAENGKPLKSGFFNGVERDEIPWSMGKADQDAGIYIYDSKTGQKTFKYKYDFTDAEKKALNEAVANGNMKVVQIADPRSHPIHGQVFSNSTGDQIYDQINFVVSNTWENKPLSWTQVEYRPGGHSIYPGRFWVSQAIVQKGRKGKWTFLGDNNVLNVGTEAEAALWAGRLDNLREMLRSGSGWSADAEKYLATELTPYSKEQIEKMFLAPGAPLRLDSPVLYRRSGLNVADEHKERLNYYFPEFVDETKSPYDLTNQMDKSYMMDRDNVISTITEAGGLSRIVPAEQMSPYTALNRAMGQALRNMGMSDYKMSAAMSFIREFGDVMNPRPEQLRAHPIYWLFNPDWNKQAYDRTKLSLAKAQQQAIVSFLGHQSDLAHDVSYMKDKLANVVYGVGGQRAVNALGLATERDPVAFFRGVAFHTNLGLFNPVQMVMQAQSLNHVMGVAGPKNGTAGLAAAMFARALFHNPEHAAAAGKRLRVFGWSQDEFTEMFEALRNSGLYHVGSEVALRDDIFDPKLFQSVTSRWLDKGAIFFNEGERIVRLTAFATAYKEWKGANKLIALDGRALQSVVDRADLLSVNMTRASSAAWQKGLLSIPTQFFAFNARLMEQFLGSRLTKLEKARALGWYSMMYGIPATAGIMTMGTSPVPGVPTSYDDITQEAMRRGIDMSPTYIQALHSGVLSVLTDALGSAIAGKEKHYNVAERFGPGTQTALSGLLRDDKSWLDIVGGASGTILQDIAKAAYPLVHTAASVFLGGNSEYKPTLADGMAVLRNIKSVDNVAKSMDIINHGQWITKNGVRVLDGVDGVDAAMVQVGLSPKDVSNTYLRQSMLKEDQKKHSAYMREAQDNFRKGMVAKAAGENELGDTYFARARYIMDSGDFTFADKSVAFQNSVQQNRDLAGKVKWDAVRKAPASQMKDRWEDYVKGLK